MRNYENLVIVKPTLTAEEIQESLKAIQEVITSNGGEIATTDDMGMRKLAYPVEKNLRGYYTILFYKANGNSITEIERNLKISEDVIKFLTIKYTKDKELAQFNKLVAIENRKSETTDEVAQTVTETVVETEIGVETTTKEA